MNQIIRTNVFETNSSSMHSLILIDKKEYEDFYNGILWFNVNEQQLYTKQDIIDSSEFKQQCENFYNLSEDAQDLEFKEFMDYNCDEDYAPYRTYNSNDFQTLEVKDTQGNDKVALSIYIGDA